LLEFLSEYIWLNLYSRLINIEGRRKWGQAEKVMDQTLRDERQESHKRERLGSTARSHIGEKLGSAAQESHRRETREYGPGVT
jgi:hypothetical protein